MKTFAASNVAKVQAEPISGDFEDEFERYLKDSLIKRFNKHKGKFLTEIIYFSIIDHCHMVRRCAMLDQKGLVVVLSECVGSQWQEIPKSHLLT